MGTKAGRWWLASGALFAAIVGLVAVAAPGRAADSDDEAETRSWIGVYTQSIDEDLREGLNYKGGGILVSRVVDDSPASKAGVRKGDVIVRFNSRPVDSPEALAEMVRDSRTGARVPLQIVRDGRQQTLNVTVAEREVDDDAEVWYWGDDSRHEVRIPRIHINKKGVDNIVSLKHLSRPMLGIQVHYLNPDLASYFGTKQGALVLEVTEKSAAAKAGIKAGDVITKVDDRTIDADNEIISELRQHEEGDSIPIVVVRKGKSVTLNAKLEDSTVGYWSGGHGDDIVIHRRAQRDVQREMEELRRELRELQRKLEDMEDDGS
jgi:serine protease Do